MELYGEDRKSVVDRIIKRITEKLVSEKIIEYEDREVYLYGLRLLATKGFTFVVALIISTLLGTVPVMLCLILFFAPIRRYGGGIHAKKMSTCFVVSEILLILFQIRLSLGLPKIVLVIEAIIGIIVIISYSPQETANKPITYYQKIKYKKTCIFYLGVEFFLFVFSTSLGIELISYSISSAFLLQAILLILGEKINNGVKECKKYEE